MKRALQLILPVLLWASPASADEAALALGKSLAEINCAKCHAIGIDDLSPQRDVPPLRDIAASYDTEELEDALNEGVPTEHPMMPDWQMTPEQAQALSLYIMSLQAAGLRKSELSD